MLLLAVLGCKEPEVASECVACTCSEENIVSSGASHVEGGVDYQDTPPTGGDHDPCWLASGVYEEEYPDERWVHSMEHGLVVYLYNCPEGCADEVAELESLAGEDAAHTIVVPYTEMDSKFAAAAWYWRITADCLEVERFRKFHEDHVDQAPESVTSDPASHCDEEDTGSTDSGTSERG